MASNGPCIRFGPNRTTCDLADVLKPFGSSKPQPDSNDTECWFQIGLATYNCLSLIDTDEGTRAERVLRQTGRAKLLAKSFRLSGITLAGVQESRLAPGASHTGSFYRISSGADSEGKLRHRALETPIAWRNNEAMRLAVSCACDPNYHACSTVPMHASCHDLDRARATPRAQRTGKVRMVVRGDLQVYRA